MSSSGVPTSPRVEQSSSRHDAALRLWDLGMFDAAIGALREGVAQLAAGRLGERLQLLESLAFVYLDAGRREDSVETFRQFAMACDAASQPVASDAAVWMITALNGDLVLAMEQCDRFVAQLDVATVP